MEKRIKFVWVLTVITLLIMIFGQSYWLYNQYSYSVNEYTEQLHEQIVKLEEKELEHRIATKDSTKDSKTNYLLQISNSVEKNSTQYIVSSSNMVSSPKNLDVNSILKNQVNKITNDSSTKTETFKVENISLDQVNNAISRYTTDKVNPFSETTFDSLLTANNIKVTKMRRIQLDSSQWVSTYQQSSQLFPPTMNVTYPYNPLKKRAITLSIVIPMNPLIYEMGWQLLGSILLLFLFVFCLVYQIKTIMMQRKIDELRKSFVNTMIHELKRPVQTLKMCVSFLNDRTMRTNEKAMDEVVQDAMFELDNLSAYLAKVRDMTRADYENTPLNIRTFDIKETIEKLIRLSNSPADKEVAIYANYEMENSLITADPVHIANIISNLIENAIKYSGKKVDINIHCKQANHALTLKVSDNGIGIPLIEQGKVFDKFYRGVNLPDRNIPGIGLGLSYVKLLTEAHRGAVSVESQPGNGTTFILSIPQ